jgi:hypothetical protein
MKIGAVALITNISLATVAIGTAFAAANAVTGVGMIALGGIAALYAGLTASAATAYFSSKSDSVDEYFYNVMGHLCLCIAAIFQLAVQSITHPAIQGAAEGLKNKIRDKLNNNKNS